VGKTGSDINPWQGTINLPQPTNNPLKDEGLFGNESDCSDFDRLDGIPKEEGVGMKETGTLCVLNEDNLLCDIKGNTNVFCLRFIHDNKLKIILSTTNPQQTPKKVRIEENDVLLVVTAKIREEEVEELVRRVVENKNSREIPIRNYSKEIAEYLEKETNTIVIAARILKGI
jgi:hypothetical protein